MGCCWPQGGLLFVSKKRRRRRSSVSPMPGNSRAAKGLATLLINSDAISSDSPSLSRHILAGALAVSPGRCEQCCLALSRNCRATEAKVRTVVLVEQRELEYISVTPRCVVTIQTVPHLRAWTLSGYNRFMPSIVTNCASTLTYLDHHPRRQRPACAFANNACLKHSLFPFQTICRYFAAFPSPRHIVWQYHRARYAQVSSGSVVRPPERRLVHVLENKGRSESPEHWRRDFLFFELGFVVIVRSRPLWG